MKWNRNKNENRQHVHTFRYMINGFNENERTEFN